MDDRVTAAIDHVARDRYQRTTDGRQLPQTSKPELIATMLRLLDVQPDQRVLEVDTGSGYSTALLAHLVGPTALSQEQQIAAGFMPPISSPCGPGKTTPRTRLITDPDPSPLRNQDTKMSG